MEIMKNNTVSKKIRHPITGKLISRVYIRGKGCFGWNSIYHVYNSDKDYSQLQKSDVKKVDYNKSK